MTIKEIKQLLQQETTQVGMFCYCNIWYIGNRDAAINEYINKIDSFPMKQYFSDFLKENYKQIGNK